LEDFYKKLLVMSGFYFFLLAVEKDTKITELKFAMVLGAQHDEWVDILRMLLKIPGIPHEGLMCLLHVYARFYQKLRMVKYKFINMKSLRKKRPEEYEVLRPFYKNGLRVLESRTVNQLGSNPLEMKDWNETLPLHCRCVGCNVDLGGQTAYIIITNVMSGHQVKHVKSIKRYTPGVAGLTDLSNPIAACGKSSCVSEAQSRYINYLVDERNALMNILPDTKICHGCSRYSMKTHRCSRCRLARYCSQACMDQNWGEHQIRCREFTRPGIKELYQTKKVVGEAREMFTTECEERLALFDPFLDV